MRDRGHPDQSVQVKLPYPSDSCSAGDCYRIPTVPHNSTTIAKSSPVFTSKHFVHCHPLNKNTPHLSFRKHKLPRPCRNVSLQRVHNVKSGCTTWRLSATRYVMDSRTQASGQNKAAKYAALRRRLVRRYGIKDPLLESSTTMASSPGRTSSPQTPSSDLAAHWERAAAALLTPTIVWSSPLLDPPLSSFAARAGTQTAGSSRASPTTQGCTPDGPASMCSWPAGGAAVLDFDPRLSASTSQTTGGWSSQRSRYTYPTGEKGSPSPVPPP